MNHLLFTLPVPHTYCPYALRASHQDLIHFQFHHLGVCTCIVQESGEFSVLESCFSCQNILVSPLHCCQTEKFFYLNIASRVFHICATHH